MLNNRVVISSAVIEEISPPPPKSLTVDEVVCAEEVIGYLGVLPIIAYFDYQQQRYFFDRVCHVPEEMSLLGHEQLFRDELIYANHHH